MIPAIESYYQRIADTLAECLPDGWQKATVEATFYSEGERWYLEVEMASGRRVSCQLRLEVLEVFYELRSAFQQHGKPVWGEAIFEIEESGVFKMRFDYDRCDEDGNRILDPVERKRRDEERTHRLSAD